MGAILWVFIFGFIFGRATKICFKNETMIHNKCPVVVWNNISDDDFVFRYRNYCLRVEQMNKRDWWWCVYYKDNPVGLVGPNAKTELEAKLLAEICFVHHFLNNII